MRELILKMTMSLDGFVSAADGDNRWMFGQDPAAKAWSVDYLAQAGLHIMGRETFHAMADHWPGSTDAFAAPMNAIPKAVFSREGDEIAPDAATLPPDGESWANAYVASGDLGEEIAALKAELGGPIIAHGGVRFARSLIAHGLVDRFALLVVPVALGRGEALFSDLDSPLALHLAEAIAFPGGAVAQIYQPA